VELNATMVKELSALFSAMSYCVVLVIGLLIGYWMGRNSAERPFRSVEAPKKRDQGSTEDPGGDLFLEALQDDKDEKKGIPTTLDQRL
jgi:hypothetical protein